MNEPHFLRHTRGLSIGEIAALTGAEPLAGARLDRRIADIAPLDRAGPSDLSFLDNAKYADQFASTHAGACLTSERFSKQAPERVVVLRVREPYRAFVAVARALFPHALRPSSLFEATGIVAGALVHPSARIENGATIDPGAVVGPRAEIGAGSVIGATAVIGPEVRIGRDCSIGSGVSIANTLIGDRVIIHPGCRIGQDGFGYLAGPKGHEKIPQIGRVIIQDDVEIGANSTIDRGGLRDTMIGEGTKIDNLVQIGHNVSIGRHCILAGQVGVSGSATIEDYVMLGGQVGVADHASIGAGTAIVAQSGIMSKIPPGQRWGGSPAMPLREWWRMIAAMRRLGRHDTTAKPSQKLVDEGEQE